MYSNVHYDFSVERPILLLWVNCNLSARFANVSLKLIVSCQKLAYQYFFLTALFKKKKPE